MPVLDLGAIERAELHQDPYQYAVIPRSFGDDTAARGLCDEFTVDGFVRSERQTGSGGGKQYLMNSRTIIKDGQAGRNGTVDLSDRWRWLIEELLSDEYRAALTTLTGTDLDGCSVEARMTRYSRGCWIEPHTDRADKAVTHLFYFNDVWRDEWDGDLRVLRGPDMADCVRRVSPLLGTSVVMVPSDHSWHGVPPVTQECPEDRRALLVHFVRA
ncbi:2OG-Fe(II) oxygenase [Streptomyces sp. NBC_01210]|uniref:2OG-Fe(II) oxygenase n=1 Tax=Streptomyces sp. NBC_01210 TaxID=2903774 RepID=UPI002E13FDE6|nr:2OG-Fe(II) oxygenase [Streptomyces sp. NBC_01210]